MGNEWESGQLVRAKLQVYGHLASWPVIPLENKKTGLLLPELTNKSCDNKKVQIIIKNFTDNNIDGLFFEDGN